MSCKGLCIRYKGDRPKSGMRYIAGQKRCGICEIYIIWEGLWCPCCGIRLRIGPRNNKKKNIIFQNIK